ncbi:MAG: Gfo/Idh/MocA family oxidoreductase [Planctomycetota bacterium]
MSKKIGVMGCGNVAGYGHLPAIRDVEGLEIGALFDPDSAVVAEMAERFHVPPERACTDEKTFFAADLDGVLISSPAPAHEVNVEAAAAAGLPILCEKPLSMDKAQGRRMITAAAAAGVPLYVAFCYRFSKAALRIKQLIDEGAIGEVRGLRLIYVWDCHGKFNHRDPTQGIAPHRDGRMREGGPMVDCGTHQIDLAQWWTGSPIVRAAGHGAWIDHADYEAPDHTWAQLTHENSAHTCVEIGYSYGHTARQPESVFQYEIIGTDGLILYDRNRSRFELRNASGTHPQEYHEEKGFDDMHRAFARALHTGRPGDLPTAEEGLRVTDLATDVTAQAIASRQGAGV